jgi:predicted transposase YdaD
MGLSKRSKGAIMVSTATMATYIVREARPPTLVRESGTPYKTWGGNFPQGEDQTPFDTGMRSLVHNFPEAFIKFGIGRGEFIESLKPEVKVAKLECDNVLKIRLDGKVVIYHLEFQRFHDPKMSDRMHEYSVLLEREYGLPVFSVVIYLSRDHAEPAQKVYQEEQRKALPNGYLYDWFRYRVIELAWFNKDELLNLSEESFIALLPFTTDGLTQDVVNYMIIQFGEGKDKERLDLLAFGCLATELLTQKDQPELFKWIKGKVKNMKNFLQESPLYQEIIQEGIDKERARGAEERKQNMLKTKNNILDFISTRFPTLSHEAKKRINTCNDSETLQDLLHLLILTTDENRAYQILVESVE